MEGAAAAAAGVPMGMVQVRGGDGVVFSVQASRLAELAPGFRWDLRAIESGDIYGIVQDYRIAVRSFTNAATGELLPEGVPNVQAIFAARVQDLDTVGHLARVAIHLGMKDLRKNCYDRVLDLVDHPIGHDDVEQFLQNAGQL